MQLQVRGSLWAQVHRRPHWVSLGDSHVDFPVLSNSFRTIREPDALRVTDESDMSSGAASA